MTDVQEIIINEQRVKALDAMMKKLHECFNSDIFSLEIKVGAFDKESGEVKEFDFAYHTKYSDKQNCELVPETSFKKFLQEVFVDHSFEAQIIKHTKDILKL